MGTKRKARERESYFWHVRMVLIRQEGWSRYPKTGPFIVVSSTKPHGEKDITKSSKQRDYDLFVFSKLLSFIDLCIL